MDRGSPNPSRHDQIIDGAIKNHATHSINPISDATTQTGFISQKNQQVIAYDGTANKALMGYNSALNKWGFFVADDGVDVTTNSDPSQLIFNSSQDVFKIVSSGTTTIPSFSISSGGNSLATIAHGQSNIPIVMVFVKATLLNWATTTAITSDYVPSPLINNTSSTAGYLFPCADSLCRPMIITHIVDNTNLYVQAAYTSSVATTVNAIPVTYFILQETAS